MKRLEVKRQLSAKSERVKDIDLHSREPWVLSTLYDGNVYIWNTQTKSLVKQIEILTGSDDMHLRVYNYNTMDKVHQWEAHQDYIRCVAVHPSKPFLLSSSDDMTIKLWDWDNNFTCTRVFEGHVHYVMQICFNPKDPNVFASASLDRTVKVWSLGSPEPNFTLEGHEKGVNCVSYYPGGDKPYLISGSDDFTVRIWDFQSKKCIQTMEGHSNNVTVVGFHPSLPLIMSGGEDGTVRCWHSDTYRLEKTLNYGFDRVWAMGFLPGSNQVAFGYDEGTILIKIGSEEPCVSMDRAGKIIWSQQSDILQGNLARVKGDEWVDGERTQLPAKDLGRCEIYPHSLVHNANGRFVAVVGDGEYIIYTALAWRNKAYGSGLDFAWSSDPKEYAVRESSSKIKLFNSFKEKHSFRPPFSAEGIFGGGLLGVRSSKFVCLYDWADGTLIRRIDVLPKALYWSDNGDFLVIASETNFYVLRYNHRVVRERKATASEDQGIDGAFDVLHEIGEQVTSGIWIGDCFLYANNLNRLNYTIGGEIVTVAHLEEKLFILGYLPKVNRVFLSDKSRGVVSYVLLVSVINYQSAVLRGDLESAANILPSIPADHRERVAQFLEAQGHKELALDVSTDPDHRFELALQLDRLDIASSIAEESDSDYKWKQLADLAFAKNKLGLAEQALQRANDLNGLLLLYLACANGAGLKHMTGVALGKGKNNVAFATMFLQNRVEDCLALLCQSNRFPEAALLARTYLPSKMSTVVGQWKQHLAQTNPREAERLADPAEYPNLFPHFELALKAEATEAQQWRDLPASAYNDVKDLVKRDLIEAARGLVSSEPVGAESSAPATNNQVEATPESVGEPVAELVNTEEPPVVGSPVEPAIETPAVEPVVEVEPVELVVEEVPVVEAPVVEAQVETPPPVVEENTPPTVGELLDFGAEDSLSTPPATGDLLDLGLDSTPTTTTATEGAPPTGDLLGFDAPLGGEVALNDLDLDWPEDVEEPADPPQEVQAKPPIVRKKAD